MIMFIELFSAAPNILSVVSHYTDIDCHNLAEPNIRPGVWKHTLFLRPGLQRKLVGQEILCNLVLTSC